MKGESSKSSRVKRVGRKHPADSGMDRFRIASLGFLESVGSEEHPINETSPKYCRSNMAKIFVFVLLLLIIGSHSSDDQFGSHSAAPTLVSRPADQRGLQMAKQCSKEYFTVHCDDDDCISYCQSEYGSNYISAECRWIKGCDCTYFC
ncbi:hypothetical protein POM88_007824 [Heracleum sosnowskyi]|uniref:Uncharacterized protein n=1 Tax=Heracleum sosnowskyi TaxID=360622 RepID=A0AAD8J892_9APIA|nr:hypothetical protein POM88_007824 [Heracleum sosnowskyi]